MPKLTLSRPYDIDRSLAFADWTSAAVTGTATTATFTLGTNTFQLQGTFTVSGGKPVSGKVTSLSYLTDGTTEFTVTGLSLDYKRFLTSIADDDFDAVFGVANDTVVGSSLADRAYGKAGNDLMQGGGGNDTLIASYGNDTLDGGAGIDSMSGGTGNDSYIVDNVNDKPVEVAAAGTDGVTTGLAAYTLPENVEQLFASSVANFTGTGNAQANLVVGNKGNDKLSGLDGHDTLRGGNGHDTLVGGNHDDFLVGDAGASAVTTSASQPSPSNPDVPITLSMTMPETVATGTSVTVTGYINNAALGSPVFNLAFVLDISGSMSGTFTGSNIGDVNRDGTANEKVDAAIASFQALVNSIKAAGLGESVRIALIPFSDTSTIQAIGTASSDSNGNGVADVIDAALLLNDTGGTAYGSGLSRAIEFLTNSPKGDNFVFFISDGQPGDTYASQLTTLRDDAGLNATIRSIGIESSGGGYYDVLDLLDDGLKNGSAIDVKSPSDLTAGLLSSNVQSGDIKQLEIYRNGVLVKTLTPAQLTETPFGLRYSVTVPGLSVTASDVIETRLVLQGAGGYLTTQQRVSLGALVSDDSLVGGSGNDTLDGGAGADTLNGGAGDDLYHIETTGKTLLEQAGGGNDTVETTLSFSLNATQAQHIENLVLLGSQALAGTGNALANRMEGNIGNNVLKGLGGSDTLVGGFGRDIASYTASTAAVTVNLGAGTATMAGEVDSLVGIEGAWGGDQADTFYGDAGDNIYRGYAGNDSFNGSGGRDTVDYTQATSAMVVTLAGFGGSASGGGEGNDSIGGDIENILGSAWADSIVDTGSNANRFEGGAGNDTLDGGSGHDTLVGGAGNDSLAGGNDLDTVDYSSSAVAVKGTLEGTMLVGTSGEADTLSGVENFIGSAQADSVSGGSLANSMDGGRGNDTLIGGIGNDSLNGGVGADSLVGGDGDDTYYVDTVSDKLVEGSTGGIDNVRIDVVVSGTMSLGYVENALVVGTAGVSLVGGAVSNSITGGMGNDTIHGGTQGEADTLSGGNGRDTLTYSGHTAGVTGTLNSLIGGDTTSYFENLVGSSFSDNLTGDYYANAISSGAGDDSVYGGSGNDTLNGGTGLDLLDGGYDFDTVSYASRASAINANLSNGQVLNPEGTDTLVAIEKVVGTAHDDLIAWQDTATSTSTDFFFEGGAGIDTLTGSSGDDTLAGGAGNDSLHGGNYLYDVDWADYSDATSAVTVDLAAGLSSGGAGVDQLTNIEGAIGSKYADSLVGGQSRSDRFQGGAGADTLDGGGNPVAGDYVRDYFVYASTADSRGSTIDTIRNYVSTGSYYDYIDLSKIDADTSDTYDDYFSFLGTGAFDGTAGQVRYEQVGGNTNVLADVNGDKVADLTVQLLGLHDLTSSHFYL